MLKKVNYFKFKNVLIESKVLERKKTNKKKSELFPSK